MGESKLMPAFVKVLKAITNAERDENNEHFRSSYASLASVFGVARPALAAEGLAFYQNVECDERGVTVSTVIVHDSGEEKVIAPVTIGLSKRGAHDIGSAITYGRRYSITAALGIATEDDDGNAAQGSAPAQRQVPPSNGTANGTSGGNGILAEVSEWGGVDGQADAISLARQIKAATVGANAKHDDPKTIAAMREYMAATTFDQHKEKANAR